MLDIYLFLSSIQFIPQIIHNFKNKDTVSNISILTQFGILISILCQITDDIGFSDKWCWQYLLVAMICLLGISIQQIQISFLSKKIPDIVNILFISSFSIAMLAMGSNSILVYKLTKYLGILVNILYWLPQMYKNHKQKKFDGFSTLFLIITLITSVFYLIDSILLSWDPIFRLSAIITLPIILVLLTQKFYYNKLLKISI